MTDGPNTRANSANAVGPIPLRASEAGSSRTVAHSPRQGSSRPRARIALAAASEYRSTAWKSPKTATPLLLGVAADHLEPDRRHVPRDAAVDRQVRREPRVVLAPGLAHVLRRVEGREPGAVADLEDLAVELLPAQPRPLVLGDGSGRRTTGPGAGRFS